VSFKLVKEGIDSAGQRSRKVSASGIPLGVIKFEGFSLVINMSIIDF
jgi:hypothetical protein